ncbi:MAG: PorP/SprF family type IX secretion system membrane protein [Saprospiraceae bacterium]
MKKILFTLIFGFSALAAFAQEQAIYSQQYAFPVLINPGYTGFEDQHQFIANYRSTWTTFPEKPSTYTLMYNGPVGDKLALGGSLFSDNAGKVSTTKLQINYAFRFQIKKLKIGLGLSTEFLNRKADAALLNDPLVERNDDVLESLVDGQQIFDASVGAYAIHDGKLFFGLTLPNTIRTRLDEAPTAVEEETNSKLFENYIFQMGYKFDMADQNFKLIPSISMRKIRDTPYQIDLNIQGRFIDEKLIAGLTFRPGNSGAAICMLGTKVSQFQLFYSYDLSLSNFQRYTGGSHELSVAYTINRKPKLVSASPAASDPIKK